MSDESRDTDPKSRDAASPAQATSGVDYPALWPPRGATHFGEYSIRDFAAKFLIQLDDFAEIERYREANSRAAASSYSRRPVVLMGDSITEFWPPESLAPVSNERVVNRGIAGQNSSVMLLRFQADVIELAPSAVVILAGTNDLRVYAGDPDLITEGALERLVRNLSAMADMAEGRGIAAVLATLPPVGGNLHQVARLPSAIGRANASILRIASERGYPLADYHAALADADGLLSVTLSDDGIHPNAAGYNRMAPILIEAIEALGLRSFPMDSRL